MVSNIKVFIFSLKQKFENLSSLAFEKTIYETAVIESEDLKRFDINKTEIGGLIVKNNCDKTKGKNQYSFASKSVQVCNIYSYRFYVEIRSYMLLLFCI